MAVQSKFTIEEIDKLLDGRYHSPIQDIVGNNYTVGSPLSMIAGNNYRFVCNGALRNFKSFPTHVTNIWNTSTNTATFSEFLNTVEMVVNVQFSFNPSSASSGTLTLKVYLNDTVPILMRQYTSSFKASADTYTTLATFYTGDDPLFDVKNKGVFFEISSSLSGELYDPSLEIYRT